MTNTNLNKNQNFYEIKERVHDELRDVFGNDEDIERDCTQQDLPNLNFLEFCIKESMRLYPPVPHIERRVDCDIPIGTVQEFNCVLLVSYSFIFSDLCKRKICDTSGSQYMFVNLCNASQSSFVPRSVGLQSGAILSR